MATTERMMNGASVTRVGEAEAGGRDNDAGNVSTLLVYTRDMSVDWLCPANRKESIT